MSNLSDNAWSVILSMNMLKLHILQELTFSLSLESSWPCSWSPGEAHDINCLHCGWIILWWFVLAIIQAKVVDIGSGRNVGNRNSGGGSGGRGSGGGGGRSHGCYRRPCSSSTQSCVCLWLCLWMGKSNKNEIKNASAVCVSISMLALLSNPKFIHILMNAKIIVTSTYNLTWITNLQ